MIKTNIKMRVTPEQSRRVQEICFDNGIEWSTSGKILQDYKFIHLSGKYLMRFSSVYAFNISELKEIDADLFIKTNGTCEETVRQYQCRCVTTPITKKINEIDFEKTQKVINELTISQQKKKIENLHIALKKKVDKNKNQALEITKLLEQKKDLQEINDSHVDYIKELENRLDQLSLRGANTNDTNNYIDDLRYRLKEKDIIISYLRSELK